MADVMPWGHVAWLLLATLSPALVISAGLVVGMGALCAGHSGCCGLVCIAETVVLLAAARRMLCGMLPPGGWQGCLMMPCSVPQVQVSWLQAPRSTPVGDRCVLAEVVWAAESTVL